MSLEKFKDLNVLVGVPSAGTWTAGFGISLVGMMTYFMAKKVGQYRTQQARLCHVRGSILPNQRLDIVREACERGCSHVLFVDTDQTFPKDTLHRLLARDVDVVAANIAVKKIPSNPTARRAPKEGEPGHGMPVFTDESSKGMEKVWRVGTGVMLIKTKVFEKTGYNIFGLEWVDEWQKYQGEDWAMCKAFEANGIDVWIDHDISHEVDHLGEFAYNHSVVGEVVQEALNG